MTSTTTTGHPEAPAQRPAVERRQGHRYRCMGECLVRLEGAAEPLDWPGMVYNISISGIGLALPFPALRGAVLTLEPARTRGSGLQLRGRVVRSELREYVWFHGCQFVTRLDLDELRCWLSALRGEPLPHG
jgi:hypothetical protein